MLNRNAHQSKPQADPLWQFEQFRLGWDFHRAGDACAICANAQQRSGWWAAASAAVDADTAAYLQGCTTPAEGGGI